MQHNERKKRKWYQQTQFLTKEFLTTFHYLGLRTQMIPSQKQGIFGSSWLTKYHLVNNYFNALIKDGLGMRVREDIEIGEEVGKKKATL
jgi:hypothetical protein